MVEKFVFSTEKILFITSDQLVTVPVHTTYHTMWICTMEVIINVPRLLIYTQIFRCCVRVRVNSPFINKINFLSTVIKVRTDLWQIIFLTHMPA